MDTRAWVLLSLQWVGWVLAAGFVFGMLLWSPKTKKQWLAYISLVAAVWAVWFIGKWLLMSGQN